MRKFSFLKPMAVLFVLFFLVSCGGTQKQADEAAPPAAVKKLNKRYETILFSTFSAKPEIAKDYPEAAKELQHSTMTTLQMEKAFKKIGTSDEKGAGATLIVKADITDMRIVSGAARMWGGAFAGSSGVEFTMQLIDGASKKVVREEKMSSWNNAWGAAWSNSDSTLLDDMGKITAQYLVDCMPKK